MEGLNTNAQAADNHRRGLEAMLEGLRRETETLAQVSDSIHEGQAPDSSSGYQPVNKPLHIDRELLTLDHFPAFHLIRSRGRNPRLPRRMLLMQRLASSKHNNGTNSSSSSNDMNNNGAKPRSITLLRLLFGRP